MWTTHKNGKPWFVNQLTMFFITTSLYKSRKQVTKFENTYKQYYNASIILLNPISNYLILPY